MRIDIEQFLALTVSIGAVGAIGVAIYTSSPDVGAAEVDPEAMETFADDFALEPPPPAAEPVPRLENPPPPAYATDLPPASPETIPGPDVESAR